MSDMTRRLYGEQGSSLVLTAIAIAALTGFAALAVDGGYLYYRHIQLQDLSDAAALAATAQLAMSSGSEALKRQLAFGAAVECVRRNGYQVVVIGCDTAQVSRGEEAGEMSVDFPEADRTQVEVAVSLNVPLFFGPVISISSSMIRAASMAQFRSDGLVPVCFFEGGYQANARYSLTLGPGDGARGNYGYLDLKPPSRFREYLESGFPGLIDFGDVLETYTGVSTGQVRQAIDNRIDRCSHGCAVTQNGGGVSVNVSENCPRLVLIPVVEGFCELHGKGRVTVKSFVRFFIEDYDSETKVLSGWCLGEAGPGGEFGLMNGFAIREVKLVK